MKGQLTLGGYVMLLVFFIIIVASVFWFGPFISSFVSTNSAYSSGYEKYVLYLLAPVLVIGGIVMFFMPNTTVR
jgi:small-conductance mechanosensitive channel